MYYSELKAQRDTKLLMNSSGEFVYNWFKSAGAVEGFLEQDARKSVEMALLDRPEILVRLALAEFCISPEVGSKLYVESDEVLQRLLLAGPSISDDNGLLLGESWPASKGHLKSLLKSKDLKSLECLFSNPSIDRELLEQLFDKTEFFADIDEELWLDLIYFSSLNEILNNKFEGYDGEGWYYHNRLFSKAWELFEKVPVSEKSRNVLVHLAPKLSGTADLKPQNLFTKWADQGGQSYASVRRIFADQIDVYDKKFTGLLKSDDLALKQSYFRRFRAGSVDEIKDMFEQYGEDFLTEAVKNKELVRNDQYVDELSELCAVVDADRTYDLLDYELSETVADVLALKDSGGENRVTIREHQELLERIDELEKNTTQKISMLNKQSYEKFSWIPVALGFAAYFLAKVIFG